ncbi:MFS transporter [Halomonas cupida]|uniref:MFS transporter n=1 Tax=Halomonas cupida TaxID=44933 RepID=A0A1M7MDM1_9GAMM|nr:MFS transporter [Halomonas cupida]GEN25760.1 MFS transporter [Halomonas cupida]SHM88919.1 Predicted arabinose efflux permease, MFS family [Halomonas cupida]
MIRSLPLPVTLLSLCQALLVTGNILLIAVSPLIGASLAPSAWLATLPVAIQWLGLMSATIPASLLMARLGRKRGFTLGNLMGLAGALLAILALHQGSFRLFCVATFAIGIGIGFGQLYRFAAVEAAPPADRDRAIGLVMGGGVLAAFFGPWLARHSHALADTEFLGSFIGLAVLYTIALIVVHFTRLPGPVDTRTRGEPRPLSQLLRQPKVVLAIISALIGYGVMTLAMTATPLAMAHAGHSFDHVSMTIQWHVVAMFAPSFITGRLTSRLGAETMIVLGCALLMASAVVGVLIPSLTGYNLALVLLGLGWNFTFLPATGLLTECYRPEEKARVQAANEFLVFSTVAVTALSAGPLVSIAGWQGLNLWLLPLPLLPIAVVLLQRLVFAPQRPQIKQQEK